MEIGQVRSLLSGYEHERGHVHGFYRRRDREDSHASPHAIVPNFPLQLEILRQRRGRLRWRVVETFRYAGKSSSNEMKILSRGTIIHSCINNRGNERRKSRSLGILLIDCSPITKLIDEEIR